MAITWADVTGVAPELAGASAEVQASTLADAALEVRPANWPSDAHADRATKYLAAHLATLSARAGSAGAIQSQTVGQVSVTYAADSSSVLGSTAYGAEYQRLKRLYFGGPRVF